MLGACNKARMKLGGPGNAQKVSSACSLTADDVLNNGSLGIQSPLFSGSVRVPATQGPAQPLSDNGMAIVEDLGSLFLEGRKRQLAPILTSPRRGRDGQQAANKS